MLWDVVIICRINEEEVKECIFYVILFIFLINIDIVKKYKKIKVICKILRMLFSFVRFWFIII